MMGSQLIKVSKMHPGYHNKDDTDELLFIAHLMPSSFLIQF